MASDGPKGEPRRSEPSARSAPPASVAPSLGRRVTVREGRPDDQGSIVEMLREMRELREPRPGGGGLRGESTGANLGSALRLVSPPILIAELGGAAAGMLLFRRIQPALLQPGAIAVEDLHVRAPYRRRGVGTALMRELVRLAAREERVRIDLVARKGNEGLAAFCARLGADRSDDLEAYRFDVRPTGRFNRP